jgi:Tfp pilus assembly protein PilO
MNTVREYRMPLIIAAGALVAILLLWSILVAPQNSKLSSLQTQQTQLEGQQTGLQAKLASLQAEGQRLSSSCADLQKITTQIPSVQTPTDIDAEESSFESQFNALAGSSGVALTQFSGFVPATGAAAATTAPAATAAGASTAASSSAVTAVPTTLAVTGNYGQIMSFVNGLDNFPRLFVIQHFNLGYGTSAASSAASSGTTGGSTSASGASATPSGPPLWIGGTPTAPSAGPYSLAITGSIYYTSTPNALEACTKATAATAGDKTTATDKKG